VAVTPFGKLDVLDVDGVAEIERAHIDADDFREILRQTFDFERMHSDFEDPARVLHALRLSKRLDRHFRVQRLVRAHRVKINVQDVALQGVMLDFLNEREAAGDLRAVRNGQIDQHVLAHSMRQEVRDFALIQRKGSPACRVPRK
jgi:hypothetical protein